MVGQRLTVTLIIMGRSVEGYGLPLRLDTQRRSPKGAYLMSDNAIGERDERRPLRIEGAAAMNKVDQEGLLVILDLHPRDSAAARQASGIETDIAQDAAVDAAVAVDRLHRGFRRCQSGGREARSLATRETSLGRRKTTGRVALSVEGERRFNGLGDEDFFSERQIRAVKIHREPLRARPLPGVLSEMMNRAT